MKKNSFRIFAGLSAAAMFAVPTVNGFITPLAIIAEETSTGSITVENLAEGQSYSVYQIFTGSFSEDGKIGDLKFNDGNKDSVLGALNTVVEPDLQKEETETDAQFANRVADAMGALAPSQKQTFANALAGKTNSMTSIALITASQPSENNLETGYYILVSTPAATDNTKSTENILIAVKGEEAVYSKSASNRPTPVKKADESEIDWKQGTGEKPEAMDVPYTITTNLSGNISDFKQYKLVIKDTLPTGVVVNQERLSTWNVKINAVLGEGDAVKTLDITSNADQEISGAETSVITWTFNDLISLLTTADEGAAPFTTKENLAQVNIVVTYTAKYSADEVGKFYTKTTTINPMTNTAQVEYSKDPFDGSASSETETSTETEEKVWTYGLKITKTNDKTGDGLETLAGAKFTLARTGDTDNISAATITESTTLDDGIFIFHGLKDGTYTLTETEVPAGYKRIDPITFTITGLDEDGNVASATGKDVTKVKIENVSDDSHAVFANYSDGAAVQASQILTLDVLNSEGINLPLTGEAGMTAGLIAGGLILAISAYAVLKNKKEENA